MGFWRNRIGGLVTTGLMFGLGFASTIEAQEVIVVLSSTGPVPEKLVEAVNSGGALPGQLGAGDPQSAYFVMSQRASGAFADWLDANPSEPRAILERSIVLRYATANDLAAAVLALSGDSNVEFVEASVAGELSVTLPNDPLLLDSGNPLTHQWGPHAVGFPDAWDRIKGHAYVGVPDVGIEATSAGDCPTPLSIREGGNQDLRAFHWNGAQYVYDSGAFRASFAKDLGNPDGNGAIPDYCVDEAQPEPADGFPGGPLVQSVARGHGTHVAGILAATTNNGAGVAGASWKSSLLVAKIDRNKTLGNGTISVEITNQDAAEGVTWLVDRGAQVLTMSWNRGLNAPPVTDPVSVAIQYATDRDIVALAAAHNGSTNPDRWCLGNQAPAVAWPARDPRVLGIGATDPDGQWACYSHYDNQTLDLVGPGTAVLSTFYTGGEWNTGEADCLDSNFNGADGYGRCSGTSMSTPMVAGLAGLLRSANPLLPKTDIEDILVSSAINTCFGAYQARCGHGTPQGGLAAEKALGSAAAQVLRNRLIPVFGLNNSAAAISDHLFTSVPQMAAAAICSDSGFPYSTAYTGQGATLAPNYAAFPGTASCGIASNREPRASFYVFSSENNPLTTGPQLLPLFRMSRKVPSFSDRRVREHRYTVLEATEIASIKNLNAGWELDGVEGFIHPPCNVSNACDATCAPPGTQLLKRYFKASTVDYVLAPASQEATWIAQGFSALAPECMGFVFPNSDTDLDGLIDGFEELVGTSPAPGDGDSDCDGVSDWGEVNNYSTASHAYGDPLSLPRCASKLLFEDEFEGSLAWDASSSSGTLLRTGNLSPIFGRTFEIEINPGWGGPDLPYGYVTDYLPTPAARYRSRFYFQPKLLSMAEGNMHSIFVLLQGSAPYAGVAKVQLRKSGGVLQVRLRAFQDNGTTLDGGWRTISGNVPTAIEIDWRGSIGTGNDAFAKLWLNGALTDVIGAPFDASDLRVGVARLGIVEGLDTFTSGVHVFDAFESRSATYIGLQP